MTRPERERGVYFGGPASRFRPIAHSRREKPQRWEKWPPHGWSHHGLDEHLDRFERARALLVALADPTACRDHIDADQARHAEMRQLGASAAALLREATDAVLAIRDFATADTREIDMRREHKETA